VPLKQRRRLPVEVGVLLVLGSAIVTATVLAAVDNVLSGDAAPAVSRASAPRGRPPVVQIGQRYPKARPRPTPRSGPPTSAPAPPPRTQPSIPLSRLVGAKVIVRMSGTTPDARLLREVRAGRVGGVILFPENVTSRSQLRSLTRRLQSAAQAGGGAGVVVAVDQEGGEVKRLAGPPYRSPAQLGASGSVSAAQSEGAATGRYLSSLGITVDFAPVLDVPAPGSFIASRAFGSTPSAVGSLGGAFATGLQDAGVTATLKHFPGLGHAVANTDSGPSTVAASRSELRRDMAAFRPAIGQGAGMVMMSNATYTAFGSQPAVLSSSIVQGELRNRLGFQGVVVTDDLEAGAVTRVMSGSAAAVSAAKAGVDMVLFAGRAEGGRAAYDALYQAARAGQLDRTALEQSYVRIEQVQQGGG
jgi:beta-N-acetylhexosaminidase